MQSELEFRKATKDDLKEIMALFRSAITAMENSGIHQWGDDYPNEEVIALDIERGQMHAGTIGGEIASVFVLNCECDGQYANGKWVYPDSTFGVVHRLCVNPAFQNQGIGTKTMDHIESILRENGTETVRLDAFSLNPAALRLYEKRGFTKVGTAIWRVRLFYLYEKKL